DATAQQQVKGGPWIGKVTHPSAAPDNHLLTVWNAKPLGDHDVDAGIYLIKSGKAIHEPGQMLRIKHDAKYDAQWPRALVPYKRMHAVRILVMDPTTDRRNGPKAGRLFRSHAMERLRILGEIPVRKFNKGEPRASATEGQPPDPDGNPDTSFLAKIPADVAWT